MVRRHDDEPVLITEAAPSYDEEFAARKKRYSIIMACRIPCLVLAGVFGIAFNQPIVAVLLIVLSVPLPWVAVLIANDRLPQKSGKVSRYQRQAPAVENMDRRVIEAAEVLDARDDARRDARAGGHADSDADAQPEQRAAGRSDDGPEDETGTRRAG